MNILNLIKEYYPDTKIDSARVIDNDIIEVYYNNKIIFYKVINNELFMFKKEKINSPKLELIFKKLKRDKILDDILNL